MTKVHLDSAASLVDVIGK